MKRHKRRQRISTIIEPAPRIEAYPPLVEWLTQQGASFQWRFEDEARTVEAWMLNGRIALIVLDAHRRGWEVFTQLETLNIPTVLSSVAKRLGIKS